MIISHKYRCIFIKTRKTGGTSLEIALSKFLGPEDIVTPISPEDERHRMSKGFIGEQNFKKKITDIRLKDLYSTVSTMKRSIYNMQAPQSIWPKKYYNHIPASLVRERIGHGIWDSYHKFTIDRNPWDLAVSLYYYAVKESNDMKELDFNNFIKTGLAYIGSNYDLYSINGVPSMDSIVKYESLENGLAEVSRDIGLHENLYEVMKEVNAKGKYRNNSDYRKMYDENLKNIISVQFAREIALIGYEF